MPARGMAGKEEPAGPAAVLGDMCVNPGYGAGDIPNVCGVLDAGRHGRWV